jgi:hypothetical protein
MREDFDRALLPRVQMLEISGYGEAKDARRGWAEIHTSHCLGALYGNPGQLRARRQLGGRKRHSLGK